MTKKQKKMLVRILITIVLMVLLAWIPTQGIVRFLLYLIPYLVIGHDILRKAFLGIKNRQVFDENFLMAIATIGALLIAVTRSGDYMEAVAVMLFYQIGELFQSYAVGKSRKNISQLMDIRPDYANIETEGAIEQVDPDEVAIGTLIYVHPGEKVPIDGIVVKGASTLNTVALTGESMPRDIGEGEEIASGCLNMTGMLTIRTTKEFGESTASKILDLVENAGSRKSVSEKFISRFAKYYTPVVCYCALALAVVPPMILLVATGQANWLDWLYRALTFLVISCPCALVISIPLTFFAGIGGASNAGILMKGSNYLETLSKVTTVVFDKTGTLTRGNFEVNSVHNVNIEENLLLEYAALAESGSSHPVGKSILRAYETLCKEEEKSGKSRVYPPDRKRISSLREVPGQGVVAIADGKSIAAGNQRLMDTLQVKCQSCDCAGTLVHVAVDREYAGYILIRDTIKPTAPSAIKALKKTGIRKTVILTGDIEAVANQVAGELGVDRVYSQLLPGDKVEKLEELMKAGSQEENRPENSRPASGRKKDVLAFVGDGINDAPVLTRAHIGIAMGAMGSDAAIEAADVVLMDDDPMKIVTAIGIARKCMSIVYQNVVFALGVKGICLILGALGLANMWLAIFADVGVMVLAVLNAIRALFVNKYANASCFSNQSGIK